MKVRREIWVIVDTDKDDTDADRVWKDSSASEDSNQQPASATRDEASLLEGISQQVFLFPA